MRLILKHIILHHSKSSTGDIVSLTGDYNRRGSPQQPYFKLFLNGRLRGRDYEPSFDGIGVPGRVWDFANYFLSEADYLAHEKVNGGYKNAAALCLVGSIFKEYTFKQLLNVILECKAVLIRFELSVDAILGHYECSKAQEDANCPDLDMGAFRQAVGGALQINNESILMAALKPKR